MTRIDENVLMHKQLQFGLLLTKGLVAWIVFAVEGWNPFAIWNCAPLVVLLLIDIGVTAASRRMSLKHVSTMLGPVLAANVVVQGLIVLGHVAWNYDLGDFATGSSTSGLIFIFLPIHAAIAGVIVGAVYRPVVALLRRM